MKYTNALAHLVLFLFGTSTPASAADNCELLSSLLEESKILKQGTNKSCALVCLANAYQLIKRHLGEAASPNPRDKVITALTKIKIPLSHFERDTLDAEQLAAFINALFDDIPQVKISGKSVNAVEENHITKHVNSLPLEDISLPPNSREVKILGIHSYPKRDTVFTERFYHAYLLIEAIPKAPGEYQLKLIDPARPERILLAIAREVGDTEYRRVHLSFNAADMDPDYAKHSVEFVKTISVEGKID